MNPLFHTGFSISDSLKSVRKNVLIYETIIYELVTAKESKAITKEILATVKAVVILKNGTKKTVKMTIKVK